MREHAESTVSHSPGGSGLVSCQFPKHQELLLPVTHSLSMQRLPRIWCGCPHEKKEAQVGKQEHAAVRVTFYHDGGFQIPMSILWSSNLRGLDHSLAAHMAPGIRKAEGSPDLAPPFNECVEEPILSKGTPAQPGHAEPALLSCRHGFPRTSSHTCHSFLPWLLSLEAVLWCVKCTLSLSVPSRTTD